MRSRRGGVKKGEENIVRVLGGVKTRVRDTRDRLRSGRVQCQEVGSRERGVE